MECRLPDNTSKFWAIVTTFSAFGFVLLVSLALYLVYRNRILEEWETMRINGLKRRYAPGTTQLPAPLVPLTPKLPPLRYTVTLLLFPLGPSASCQCSAL